MRASSFVDYTPPMAKYNPQTARQRRRPCTRVLNGNASRAGRLPAWQGAMREPGARWHRDSRSSNIFAEPDHRPPPPRSY